MNIIYRYHKMQGPRPQMVRIFIEILKIFFYQTMFIRAGLQKFMFDRRTDYIYMYFRNNRPTRYLRQRMFNGRKLKKNRN